MKLNEEGNRYGGHANLKVKIGRNYGTSVRNVRSMIGKRHDNQSKNERKVDENERNVKTNNASNEEMDMQFGNGSIVNWNCKAVIGRSSKSSQCSSFQWSSASVQRQKWIISAYTLVSSTIRMLFKPSGDLLSL